MALYRRHRDLGVAIFVVLVLLVGAERRLAEVHVNLPRAEGAFENDDALGGDELRVRLLVLNDDKPPTLPAVVLVPLLARVHTSVARSALEILDCPAPRGPPACSTV